MPRNSGREFENAVAAILESAGIDVQRNIQIDHQQVDVFALRRDLGRIERIAVECKDWARHLEKDEIALIYVKYESLIEKHHIDYVFLVTKVGITANANSYVADKRNLRHLTINQLQSTIMDFVKYLSYLESAFHESGLEHYYIPLSLNKTNGQERCGEALPYFHAWLEDSTRLPLALLSGYGMGKSTLCLMLAHEQALRHKADPEARIPILIDLGKISDVQGLEGLLGKVLTSDNVVAHYSFPLFMELNRRGRFLIILDSFDEMKHGISWEAFISNLEEIRRLLSPESKVVICGRPSIFLSEAEQVDALHGKRMIGGKSIQSHHFSGFEEVSIVPLTNPQIHKFLSDYLGFLASKGKVDRSAATIVHARLSEGNTGAFYDMASRPVQLHMLASVLPKWNEPLDALTLTILYDYFIDHLLAREMKKNARMPIGLKARRRFSRALAWYMWRATRKDYIRANEIPDSVISAAEVKNSDTAVERRELIAGCCLDLKPPDLLRFSHRSLQEFLVAQELEERLRLKTISIASALDVATPEVQSFLAGMLQGGPVDFLAESIRGHTGPLPQWLEHLLVSDPALAESLWDTLSRGLVSLWPGVLTMVAVSLKRVRREEKRKVSGRHPTLDMIYVDLLEASKRLAAVGKTEYLHLAFHCLFLRFFQGQAHSAPQGRLKRSSGPGRAPQVGVSGFLDAVEEMLKLDIFEDRFGEAYVALGRFLHDIAIYGGSLELGSVRKTILETYQRMGFPSLIWENDHEMREEFGFTKSMHCTWQEATRFKRLRDEIEGHRA